MSSLKYKAVREILASVCASTRVCVCKYTRVHSTYSWAVLYIYNCSSVFLIKGTTSRHYPLAANYHSAGAMGRQMTTSLIARSLKITFLSPGCTGRLPVLLCLWLHWQEVLRGWGWGVGGVRVRVGWGWGWGVGEGEGEVRVRVRVRTRVRWGVWLRVRMGSKQENSRNFISMTSSL